MTEWTDQERTALAALKFHCPTGNAAFLHLSFYGSLKVRKKGAGSYTVQKYNWNLIPVRSFSEVLLQVASLLVEEEALILAGVNLRGVNLALVQGATKTALKWLLALGEGEAEGPLPQLGRATPIAQGEGKAEQSPNACEGWRDSPNSDTSFLHDPKDPSGERLLGVVIKEGFYWIGFYDHPITGRLVTVKGGLSKREAQSLVRFGVGYNRQLSGEQTK